MQGYIPEDIAADINRFRTSKMGPFRRNRMPKWLEVDATGKPVKQIPTSPHAAEEISLKKRMKFRSGQK